MSEEMGCDLRLASLIVEKDRQWGVACVGRRWLIERMGEDDG